MGDLNFGDVASQDIRGAVQHLKKTGSPKVAVTGFCMGGALTLLSAVHVPELDASVVWYGYPPLEYIDASKIQKPLQGHWALHDEFFPIAGVDQLENNLKAASVSYNFYRYDAKHAFTNPEADARHLPPLQYNAAATKEAWQRTHAFLKTHVG
jgi:carboxymethylenebutenolidase